MNYILKPFLRKFVLVFLDDILTYNSSMADHVHHIQEVLDQLREHKIYLKQSLDYLGHIISGKGVNIDPSKIEAMLKWPTPTSFTELRAFLGLIGYYRIFVRGYSLLTEPMTNLLRQKEFKWTHDAQMAFEQTKQAMTKL
jgi:hypothetical protein